MSWPVWFWGSWDSTAAAISSANAAWLQLPIATVAAGVTAWAAIAASRAAIAAEKSVEVAGDTATRQLRAYVLVDGAALTFESGGLLSPIPTAGARPLAQVRIRNSGQTPARGVKVRTALCLRPLPIDSTTLLLNNPTVNSQVDLGAGSGCNSTVAAPGILDEGAAAAIRALGQGIFLIGEVIYQDIFGIERRTKFSMVNAAGHHDGTMSFTVFGNEAD